MTVVCDAGTTPRPPQPPRVTPAGPIHHSRRSASVLPAAPPSVIPAGCKRESMAFSPPPRRQTWSAPPPPTRPAPGSRPVPLDSRLRGNDSRVRRGDHPTTNPAPSVTPVGPLPSFPPVPSSFPPVPSIIPASPPLSFPQVVSGNPGSFLLPPKADMERPTTPTRPAPGSRPVPLDSRLRGNDSRVRRRDHPTTNPAPSVTLTAPLRHSHQPPPSLPPVRLCHSRRSPLCHSRRL